MLPPAIADYLETHRDENLRLLMELLRFPTLSTGPDEPTRACAAWLAGKLRAMGFSVELAPAGAGKPNVIASAVVDPSKPTLLIYEHYDVQPPEPLNEWLSDPFEPVIRDGAIYARGSDDDKGPLAAYLACLGAYKAVTGTFPVNIKCFFEGQEEIGSPGLEGFFLEHADELAADAAVISDSGFFADDVPSITYALRGLVYAEITVTGPSADIHSGSHGGAITNPVNALARILTAAQDADGRVTLPGFYDDILPPAPEELADWARLPHDDAAYAASMGVGALGGGERGLPSLQRRWSRPTFDANGIVGGYTGPGAKTIIPAKASAKVSMRLVPNQRPEKIADSLRRFLADNTPPGVQVSLQFHSNSRPVLLATDSPAMTAAKDALADVFGRKPVMIRGGGSVPVTELIQRILGLDSVLLGFGLPGNNVHSPNEHFPLDQYHRAALCLATFLANFAQGGGHGR
ncbi:MAG: M20/M25/M40 family metallo-hydrolase [Planctomycetota bacterium]|nr:M20/M25/M40 family metallo-hydrolase [Planctomycetota bacterium]